MEKYQAKVSPGRRNQYLDLINPSFQGVNTLFLSLEIEEDRKVHTEYYLPKVEIKDYVMIDGKNVFDQPVKSDMKTYDNIQKKCNRSRR